MAKEKLSNDLKSCCTKCGPWVNNICVTWEPVRNVNLSHASCPSQVCQIRIHSLERSAGNSYGYLSLRSTGLKTNLMAVEC